MNFFLLIVFINLFFKSTTSEEEYIGCSCPVVTTKDYINGAIIGASTAFGIFLFLMLVRCCMKKHQKALSPFIRCFFCL